VLEYYRTILAYRKGSKALLEGKTVFHDLPEPLLAFTREADGGALLCVFNLSPSAQEITIDGASTLSEASLGATLKGQTLTLAPNAAAFLPVIGTATLTA
jgi:alpha-glucosidase